MAATERRKKKINLEIGIRLRDIRETLGYSQYEFGKILHVSQDHYRKIEGGTSAITLDKFQLLYDKFGIEPSYLILGNSNQDINLEEYLEKCRKDERKNILGKFVDYMVTYVGGR